MKLQQKSLGFQKEIQEEEKKLKSMFGKKGGKKTLKQGRKAKNSKKSKNNKYTNKNTIKKRD